MAEDKATAVELLHRLSYIDEVLGYCRDHRDAMILQYLMDDPDYSDILRRKFFYPDKESMLLDIGSPALLIDHIQTGLTALKLHCRFDCNRYGQNSASDSIRFLFAFSGHCICYSGGRHYYLNTGDTLIIPAGIELAYEGVGIECQLIQVFIEPEYFQRTLIGKLPGSGSVPARFFQTVLDDNEKTVQLVSNSDPERMQNFLLSALCEYHYRKLYYIEPMEGYLALFITELLRLMAGLGEVERYTRSGDEKRILDIRRYIEIHNQDITLIDAAEHFHFTPSYLSQFISKNTGQTFTQLVQEARLQEASRLLLNTTMNITEIITSCGYQNASYFYRIFSERYGCTPSQYRQKNYGGEEGTETTDNSLPK